MNNAPDNLSDIYDMPEKPKRDQKVKESSTSALGEGMDQSRRMGGIVLIAIGVVFLAQQLFGIALSGNWWAIFIFAPAITLLYSGYSAYSKGHVWTAQARGQISAGTMVMIVAVLALFGRWDLWPLFLIAGGALALFGFNR
jgi:cation transport ATPase